MIYLMYSQKGDETDMNIQFVKYLKDVHEPDVKEWEVSTIKGVTYCHSVETRTYYEACYVADVNINTHGIDEKTVLSLLHRKNKEMHGEGIAKYLETVRICEIVDSITNFKPYKKEDYNAERTQGYRDGMLCEFNNIRKNTEMNLIKIAYKMNGEYEYLSGFPCHTNMTFEEWNALNTKDKFYFGGLYHLNKHVWKILYKLKAKGFVSERYVKGGVSVGRGGRYSGKKSKRFYTLTDEGREYLKSLK